MAVNEAHFRKLLREKGLKVTNQRLRILEVLESSPNRHLTAEEIYRQVKDTCPDMGLATVYRTIQLFLELQLIDRIDLNDGLVRYEIGEAGQTKHRHHHLICRACGKVQAFEDDLLEELETKLLSGMPGNAGRAEAFHGTGITETKSGGVLFFEKYQQFKIENHSPRRTGADRNEHYCL